MFLASHSPVASGRRPADVSGLDELSAVMAMLQSVIAEENDFLRSGLPASLFEWKEYKQDLADQYSALSDQISDDLAEGQRFEPEVLRGLIEQTGVLRRLADENLLLLDGAISATRRRIDAVIAAAHAGRTSASRYDGKGEATIAGGWPRTTRFNA